MKPIIISGAELCVERISGIQRYMVETLRNIDLHLQDNPQTFEVRLCYPEDSQLLISDFKSINMIPLKYNGKGWNTRVLKQYVENEHGIFCGFSNNITLCKDSIILLHDIRRLETFAYDSFRACMNYRITCGLISLFAKTIVTDSEYQQRAICSKLHKPQKSVEVFYAGYEHIERVDCDASVFDTFPLIEKNNYYYSLGSIAKHKNYNWILEVAKRNPDKQFVVAGSQLKEKWGTSADDFKHENIIYVGYVTDEQNKALLKECKAFLQPSFYEGFGLPPLEALVLGKPIMVSSATCLPEIYEGIATIFDPNDYSVDLNDIHIPTFDEISKMKNRYSWKRVAADWVELFRKSCEVEA
jgi:glycosyltransferase involved in cell wall biosynthesis